MLLIKVRFSPNNEKETKKSIAASLRLSLIQQKLRKNCKTFEEFFRRRKQEENTIFIILKLFIKLFIHKMFQKSSNLNKNKHFCEKLGMDPKLKMLNFFLKILT